MKNEKPDEKGECEDPKYGSVDETGLGGAAGLGHSEDMGLLRRPGKGQWDYMESLI